MKKDKTIKVNIKDENDINDKIDYCDKQIEKHNKRYYFGTGALLVGLGTMLYSSFKLGVFRSIRGTLGYWLSDLDNESSSDDK